MRAVAFVIDFVLLSVSWLFLFLLMAGWLFSLKFVEQPLTAALFFAMYLIVFIMGLVFMHMAYCTLMHAWLGQTIGKLLMGIKVVTTDNRQAPVGITFLRWTGYIVSFIPLASGFLWSAVDKDHCAWLARLAQTMVVSAKMT